MEGVKPCPAGDVTHSYNKTYEGQVSLGNNMACHVIGIGSVQI